MNRLVATSALVAAAMLTGCASPKPRVSATDDLSVIEALQKQQGRAGMEVVERDMAVDDDGRIVAETTAVATGPVLPRPQGPVPVRLPAMIMRVWIAPWEDSTGNLHAPGYVYTEIEPRRWSIGMPDDRIARRVLTPLQIEDRTSTGTN